MWPKLSRTHPAQPKLPLPHILFKQYLNSCDIQCFKSVGALSPQSNHCNFCNKVLSSKKCPAHSFCGSCKLTVPWEAESPNPYGYIYRKHSRKILLLSWKWSKTGLVHNVNDEKKWEYKVIIFVSVLEFYKKFLERWTAEVFIHTPGNEIGLIGQYWPASGVNFTNILQAAFTHTDPKKCKKKTVKSCRFLRFWDRCGIQAVHKHVDKVTQGVNVTNILQAAFLHKSVLRSFSVLTVCVYNFLALRKSAQKLLLKLTAAHHVKMVPGKETDIILSVKHEISKNENCNKDTSFSDFVNCFKTELRNKLLNTTSCTICHNYNVSLCGIPYMKYFLNLEKDLPFCSSTKSAQCSFKCFHDLLR